MKNVVKILPKLVCECEKNEKKRWGLNEW